MSSQSISVRALYATLLLVLVGVTACAPSTAAPTPAPAVPAAVETDRAEVLERHLTSDAIFRHIAHLASDEMRGRDTPSPELEEAARYIADHFRASGIGPAGDGDDDYFQRWDFERLEVDRTRTRLSGDGPGVAGDWRYGTDFFAIPSPPTPVSGPPFFLGTPERLSAGLPSEAGGRLLMAYLPEGLGPEFGMVIQAAMQVGSPGVLLLLDPDTDGAEIFQIAAALEGGAAGQLPIPVFGLAWEAWSPLLESVGVVPDDPEFEPRLLEDLSFSMESAFAPRSDEVSNVVGIVRGSDPALAGTYIVLTAHFDHVGVGPPDATGDSIFNGADDNASGTAALMQIGAALAALPTAPRRSIVLLAVSGEEKGLLGSAYYAEHPTVPGEDIIANINLDMIGRNHPDTLHAIGEEFTTIGALAHRVAREHPELGLVLAPDPAPEEQAFLRSDHFSFVEKGIPALFFTTWLHDDYHLPSDTPDLIDQDKTARVARLVFHLTLEIANSDGEPRWTEEGRALLSQLGF